MCLRNRREKYKGLSYPTAAENYEMGYIRPQESGSHCACTYLDIKDLVTVTASAPFSCSVNPYTSKQLWETKHYFELPQNDFVNVCVDLGMRGVGSYSCGPELDGAYEIPRHAKTNLPLPSDKQSLRFFACIKYKVLQKLCKIFSKNFAQFLYGLGVHFAKNTRYCGAQKR